MSVSKIIGGALAASLALAAQAQVTWPPSKAKPQPRQQPQTAPAPAPAPQGQPAGQASPGPAAQQLTAEQRSALGVVQFHNQLGIQAGDAGANRGSSDQVKNLGRWIAENHRSIETQLAPLLQQRGADMKTLAPPPEKERIEGELQQLSARSGEDFDKEFVAFLTRNQPAFVEALKRARDVTSGKDPQLKKFLDDFENLEEAQLSAARQLKTQRQARTPPAR